MRLTPVLTAAALVAGLASAAVAQPASVAAAPPSPAVSSSANDFTPTTTAADMAALDARIENDGDALLRRISADLVRGDARMRAIQPALAFHGATFLPNFYVGVPKPYQR